MTKRLRISKQVGYLSTYELEGNLSLIVERIQKLIKEHGPDARLMLNEHFYYDYDNEPTPRFELYVDREENDAEVMQRLFEQAEYIHKKEEAEKAEFERLAKKFGMTNE